MFMVATYASRNGGVLKMQLEQNFVVKQLLNCAPGELVSMTLRTRAALTIVLSRTAQEMDLAVLSWGDSAFPMYVKLAGIDHPCVSYGTDWVFQPIAGDETNSRNRDYVGSHGAVHVSSSALLLNLGPTSGDSIYDSITYDLGTLQMADVGNGLPIAEWKIWPNKGEFDAEFEPLFSFKATPRNF